MPLKKNLGLKFDRGLLVGSWNVPDPKTQPFEFLRFAEDIGWHIAMEIARGATSCAFVEMPPGEKGSHEGKSPLGGAE